jgi:hypothetical protein
MADVPAPSLPEWAQELVDECEQEQDFTTLATALEKEHYKRFYRLPSEQLQYLYGRAEDTFLTRARHWYFQLKSGRPDNGHRLLSLINIVHHRGGLDLKTALDLTPTDWLWLQHMGEVSYLAQAYQEAQGDNELASTAERKFDLAKNLISPHPIEDWEYGAERPRLLELAREGYQGQLRSDIEDCRDDDYRTAKTIRKAVTILGFELHELGLTEKELTIWEYGRQLRVLDDVLRTNTDALTLFLNTAAPLRLMVRHDISPKRIGISRAKLITARDRLAAWLPRAIKQPVENTSGTISRNQLQEYLSSTLPLFDQVLDL